ncbi:unnamed protein product [Amoebophrya sp. A120]|nr:unnamed protein product [Amoebophrya sp. A120]|eukprot:GSA120T00016791001.1
MQVRVRTRLEEEPYLFLVVMQCVSSLSLCSVVGSAR